MAYNDQTQYPRGIHRTAALTNGAPVVLPGFEAGTEHRIAWVQITHTANFEVLFTNAAGTVTYLQLNAQANDVAIVPRGWYAADGLRIAASSGLDGGSVTVVYFDD